MALTGGTSTPIVDNIIVKYSFLPAPTGISTSIINTSSITVSWTDNSSDETGFIVEKSTDGIVYALALTAAAEATSTALSGLTANTPYWFRVAAVNSINTSTYVTTGLSTYTLANVPTLVSVAATANGMVFSWTGDATAYYAEDTTAGTNSGWTTDTAFGASGINCGTSHNFRVKGRSGDGTETAFTSEMSGTTNICGVAGLTNPGSGGSGSSAPSPAPTNQTQPAESAPTVSPFPTPAPTIIFIHTLRVGWRGAEVKQLQQKLRELGYFKYPTNTGYFGYITRAAVIAFQKARGLAPYPGWVGPLTRAALNALSSQ